MPSQSSIFHANIAQLLADSASGEIAAAALPGEYQRAFGEPIVLKSGGMKVALQRAEASGVCALQERPQPDGEPALYILRPATGGYRSPFGPKVEARAQSGMNSGYTAGNGLGATSAPANAPK